MFFWLRAGERRAITEKHSKDGENVSAGVLMIWGSSWGEERFKCRDRSKNGPQQRGKRVSKGKSLWTIAEVGEQRGWANPGAETQETKPAMIYWRYNIEIVIPTITENGAAKKESSFIADQGGRARGVFDIRILFRKLPLFQSAPFGSGEMPINFASFIMSRSHCVRWRTTSFQQLKLVLCILQEWWENTEAAWEGEGDASRNSTEGWEGFWRGSLCEVLDFFFSWERVGHYFSKNHFPSCKLISFTPNFRPATPAQ